MSKQHKQEQEKTNNLFCSPLLGLLLKANELAAAAEMCFYQSS
jgi:hypothetical protein